MNLFFDWTGHKKLWNWLALHPHAGKADWPGWANEKHIPNNRCFACEFARKLGDSDWFVTDVDLAHELCVQYCPLDWGEECSCLLGRRRSHGLYKRWLIVDTPLLRAYYARRIATLPLKSWVEGRWLV